MQKYTYFGPYAPLSHHWAIFKCTSAVMQSPRLTLAHDKCTIAVTPPPPPERRPRRMDNHSKPFVHPPLQTNLYINRVLIVHRFLLGVQ
jgi:hypothetical protein